MDYTITENYIYKDYEKRKEGPRIVNHPIAIIMIVVQSKKLCTSGDSRLITNYALIPHIMIIYFNINVD